MDKSQFKTFIHDFVESVGNYDLFGLTIGSFSTISFEISEVKSFSDVKSYINSSIIKYPLFYKLKTYIIPHDNDYDNIESFLTFYILPDKIYFRNENPEIPDSNRKGYYPIYSESIRLFDLVKYIKTNDIKIDLDEKYYEYKIKELNNEQSKYKSILNSTK